MTDPGEVQRFAFQPDGRFAVPLRALGVRPDHDGVFVGEGRLVVRFGRVGLRTPLENVARAHEAGEYRWWRAVGARLSLADRGVTFGTSTRGGVCIEFHRPVRALLGLAHPNCSVTVADPPGLVAALNRR